LPSSPPSSLSVPVVQKRLPLEPPMPRPTKCRFLSGHTTLTHMMPRLNCGPTFQSETCRWVFAID
jgi:hypothetical protein